jgi:hypothetical protein
LWSAMSPIMGHLPPRLSAVTRVPQSCQSTSTTRVRTACNTSRAIVLWSALGAGRQIHLAGYATSRAIALRAQPRGWMTGTLCQSRAIVAPASSVRWILGPRPHGACRVTQRHASLGSRRDGMGVCRQHGPQRERYLPVRCRTRGLQHSPLLRRSLTARHERVHLHGHNRWLSGASMQHHCCEDDRPRGPLSFLVC